MSDKPENNSETLNTVRGWFQTGAEKVRAGLKEAKERNPSFFDEGRKFMQAVQADTKVGQEKVAAFCRQARIAWAEAAVNTLSDEERQALQESLRYRNAKNWNNTPSGGASGPSSGAGSQVSNAQGSVKAGTGEDAVAGQPSEAQLHGGHPGSENHEQVDGGQVDPGQSEAQAPYTGAKKPAARGRRKRTDD